MELRSRRLLARPEGGMFRALFKSMDYDDRDLEKPIVAIANSWSSICPGHYNLREVSERVKAGIHEAGGTAVEFGVIGACDGLAQRHEGMRYILPTRELIAADVETMIQAHPIDAVALLGSCDKIVPGMLMAAARLDVPAVLVCGGPMCSKKYAKWNAFGGDRMDISSVMEAAELVNAGKMSEADFLELEQAAAGGPGSCQYLGTANSMCCFAEALGMSLPGTATIPAVSRDRLEAGRLSGKAVMKLVDEGITARRIINREGIENAVMIMSAIGGSTNSVLHALAIAHEANVAFSLKDLGEISKRIPQIASVLPASKYDVTDFHEAGGVRAVMRELGDLLHTESLTVSGRTTVENVACAKTRNRNVIKTTNEPFARGGGLVVLYGNLAPDGAVTKKAAIPGHMLFFEGPARVFDGEQDAIDGIRTGRVHAGDVVVIRYEGPKGGPGMPEMYSPLKTLAGAGLLEKAAVVTDGRFSGSNNGLAVGYVSPEAQEGGPLAALGDGDLITIDVQGGRLSASVPDERLKSIKVRPVRPRKGYLGLYSMIVSSASEGAIIDPERVRGT